MINKTRIVLFLLLLMNCVACDNNCSQKYLEEARGIMSDQFISNGPFDEVDSKALASAKKYAEKSINCDSNCYPCHYLLRDILEKQDDKISLISTYDRLVALNSSSLQLHFLRGRNFLDLKDTGKAHKDFKYIMANLPEQPSKETLAQFEYYKSKYYCEYYIFGVARILEIEKKVLADPKLTKAQVIVIEEIKDRDHMMSSKPIKIKSRP